MLRTVWPDFSDERSLSLFHKGVKGQWAADTFDWSKQVGMDEFERTSLARLVTPVYVGEETALAGASAVIVNLFGTSTNASERLFLASFALDEARHFDILTRLYNKIDRRPLEILELRQMLRYHAALLRSKHPVPWMWGILVSDLFAKHFYGTFYRTFPDTLFGELSGRILVDESRHQAFAEHFLSNARLDSEMKKALLNLRDELLDLMQQMYKHLKPDIDTFGFDAEQFFARLMHDIETKLTRLEIYDGKDEGRQHDEDEARLIAELEGHPGTQD